MTHPSIDIDQQLWELQNNPDRLDDILQVLITTELYCLGEIIESADESVESTDLVLTSWEDEEGHTFIPCFTSYDNMATILEEDSPYVLLQGHDLFTLVNDDIVIINPELSNELVLYPEDLKKLAKH